jgi:hypothetical protein
VQWTHLTYKGGQWRILANTIMNEEEYRLLGYNAMWFVESQPTFRRSMLLPSSGSKNKPSKKPVFASHFMLVSCLVYFSTLKMEATCFSGKSVHFQWTTRRYIPEDKTLHNRS